MGKSIDFSSDSDGILSARSRILDHIIIEDSFMGYVTVNIEKGHITRQIKRALLWTAIAAYSSDTGIKVECDGFTIFKYNKDNDEIERITTRVFAEAAEFLGNDSMGVIFNGDKCYDECIEGEWKYTKL